MGIDPVNPARTHRQPTNHPTLESGAAILIPSPHFLPCRPASHIPPKGSMYLTARLVLRGFQGCLYFENLGASTATRADTTQPRNPTTQPDTARHDATRHEHWGIRSSSRSRSSESNGSGNEQRASIGNPTWRWEMALSRPPSSSGSRTMPLVKGKGRPSPSPSFVRPCNACVHATSTFSSSQQPAACIGPVPSAPHERVAGGID